MYFVRYWSIYRFKDHIYKTRLIGYKKVNYTQKHFGCEELVSVACIFFCRKLVYESPRMNRKLFVSYFDFIVLYTTFGLPSLKSNLQLSHVRGRRYIFS